MATLKDTLTADMRNALKARDELTTSTLRMALAAIGTAEVAGKEKRELSDEEVLGVLTKEAKKRREAATAFADAGRAEQAAKETAEGEVLDRYLPKQLGDEELAEHRGRRAGRGRLHRDGPDGPGHEGDPGRGRGPGRGRSGGRGGTAAARLELTRPAADGLGAANRPMARSILRAIRCSVAAAAWTAAVAAAGRPVHRRARVCRSARPCRR